MADGEQSIRVYARDSFPHFQAPASGAFFIGVFRENPAYSDYEGGAGNHAYDPQRSGSRDCLNNGCLPIALLAGNPDPAVTFRQRSHQLLRRRYSDIRSAFKVRRSPNGPATYSTTGGSGNGGEPIRPTRPVHSSFDQAKRFKQKFTVADLR